MSQSQSSSAPVKVMVTAPEKVFVPRAAAAVVKGALAAMALKRQKGWFHNQASSLGNLETGVRSYYYIHTVLRLPRPSAGRRRFGASASVCKRNARLSQQWSASEMTIVAFFPPLAADLVKGACVTVTVTVNCKRGEFPFMHYGKEVVIFTSVV